MIAIASVSDAEPIFPPSDTTIFPVDVRVPPLIPPVVVIVDEPLLMLPKPEVIEPAFNAPTVVTFDNVSNALSK